MAVEHAPRDIDRQPFLSNFLLVVVPGFEEVEVGLEDGVMAV